MKTTKDHQKVPHFENNAQNTRAASIKEYETLSTHIFSN